MPPRSDPPVHPLDQAIARFRAAGLLDKPTAAEHAIVVLVASIKRLEADVAGLQERLRGPAPPRCWPAPGAPM